MFNSWLQQDYLRRWCFCLAWRKSLAYICRRFIAIISYDKMKSSCAASGFLKNKDGVLQYVTSPPPAPCFDAVKTTLPMSRPAVIFSLTDQS